MFPLGIPKSTLLHPEEQLFNVDWKLKNRWAIACTFPSFGIFLTPCPFLLLFPHWSISPSEFQDGIMAMWQL
jgi:hypothetical protein